MSGGGGEQEENEMVVGLENKWAYLTYGAKFFDPVMAHICAYIKSQNKKASHLRLQCHSARS